MTSKVIETPRAPRQKHAVSKRNSFMSARFLALAAVIVLFLALTVLALMEAGYLGILTPHFRSFAGAQVFVDLVIMCVLGCVWMVIDSRQSGIAAWPFIAITLVAGSFGPLLYLAVRELRGARAH
jgi:hypothetical protein